MTAIVWGALANRQYNTGIDRAVLYTGLSGESAYLTAQAWDGLVSLTDNSSSAGSEEFYWDGRKYADRLITAPYTGTLEAFETPSNLLGLNGIKAVKPGFFVQGQDTSTTFGLTFRTRVPNAISAAGAYLVHLLYGLTAVPTDITNTTISDDASAVPRQWTLTGAPVSCLGFKPSCHFVLDSRYLTAAKLKAVEQGLYGTSSANGSLSGPDAIAATL